MVSQPAFWRRSRSQFNRRHATGGLGRLELLEARAVFSVNLPFPAPVPGATISGVTPHTWVADSSGLYHTATDLAAEWSNCYSAMLAGKSASLTPIQRLEGNAEAVFENTGLRGLSAAELARDREDAQRCFDAVAGAMSSNQAAFGTRPESPLTERTYVWLGRTIQNDASLFELALQGHGLNSPPAARYAGFTNDFQNTVDTTTLYVGGGLGNGEQAIAGFFDDVLLGHSSFPVVFRNGQLVQLNQNAAAEDRLGKATEALDDFMYGRVLQAADFATTAPSSTKSYVPLYHSLVKASRIDVTAAPAGGTMQGLLGAVSTTIAGITPHAWRADASGQFHPVDSAGRVVDLAAEWQGYSALMLAGRGAGLTAVQRLEGNAETIFQHTAIAAVDPRLQSIYREDAQREFDALGAAQTLDFQRYGIDPRAPFTPQTYLTLERTIQSDATLFELAVQGHGLNSPPAARYRGYTNDFQHNVDATTRYVGPGLNRGHNALTDLFDDNVISHVCFPTVWHDGTLVQLNQNANLEDTLDEAVDALNYSAFSGVYTWQDFAGSRVSGTLTDTAGGPLANWVVYADANANGRLDKGEVAARTNSAGDYTLVLVIPDAGGTVAIREIVPEGWRQIAPDAGGARQVAFATPRTTVTGVGFVAQLVSGTVSGTVSDVGGKALAKWKVFADLNNNGRADAGEPSTCTKDDGRYTLIVPATVEGVGTSIRVVLPKGWQQAASSAGSGKVVTIHIGDTVNGFGFTLQPPVKSAGIRRAA